MSRSMLPLAAALTALLLGSVAVASPLGDLSAFGYNPKANNASVIVLGSARFTVLTDYVIRMEYDIGQQWEDRATIAFVNRDLPVPHFTHTQKNGLLTITTSKISMRYVVDSPFSWQTLTATSSSGAVWKYGDVDHGNLFGTVRSLDVECTVPLNCTMNAGMSVHNESLHCAWGVISRGGWTTIDDTGNFIMGGQPGDWFSADEKNTDEIDLYFFGHATNYRQALQDFTDLAGKIPMLPRPMLGSWYTRWFDFDNSDIERLVEIYEKESVPLTLMVFDMNWHTKNDWTGYTWDKQLFPNPEDNLAWLRNKGLIVAANMHDADGVGWWEDKYKEMCMVMGQDPSTLQAVPFQPLNDTYMHALEDICVKHAGLDLTWIDWQQGGWAGGCTGGRLNPTLITDHVRGTDHLRQGVNQRDAVLARFGGLGNHRYQVGFSGDVLSLTWECMAFQPYFSVTGANVGYGYWSNDLVGPANDHELHVRWMQWGAFSGIMRIHDRGMSTGPCYSTGTCAIVNIWKIPFHYFDAIRLAMTARVALLPYLYGESYNAYLTGVTPVYPMYYDYASHSDAYAMGPDGTHAQYMFGSQIIIAPICAAASNSTALATKEIWLPPGLWYDDVFGALHNSIGDYIESNYALEDVPTFIKAGAIIPRLPHPEVVGVGTKRYDALDIYIYPGATSGSYMLYEDDGMNYDYLKHPEGSNLLTNISYTASATGITITVAGTAMTAAWLPTMRHLRFFLVQAPPLTAASAGRPATAHTLPYARFGGDNTWTFDGKTVTTIVDCGSRSTADSLTVTATYAPGISTNDLGYAKGFASRSRLGKRILDDLRITPDEQIVGPGLLKQAGARAVDLTYLAGTNITMFKAKLVGVPQSHGWSGYTSLMREALSEIGGNPSPSAHHSQLTQLYDSNRNDMLLCGSKNCLNTNYQYTVMWNEGYQPSSVSTDSVPLYDYYSSSIKDNYATTDASPPSGYAAAVFKNGKVYSNSATGRVCLDVFFNPSTGDHLTTSTQQGRDFARGNSYVKSHNCIAYVDAVPPLRSGNNGTKHHGMTAGEFAKIFDSLEDQVATRTSSSGMTSTSFRVKKSKTTQIPNSMDLKKMGNKNLEMEQLEASAAMTMAQALIQSCLPPS